MTTSGEAPRAEVEKVVKVEVFDHDCKYPAAVGNPATPKGVSFEVTWQCAVCHQYNKTKVTSRGIGLQSITTKKIYHPDKRLRREAAEKNRYYFQRVEAIIRNLLGG